MKNIQLYKGFLFRTVFFFFSVLALFPLLLPSFAVAVPVTCDQIIFQTEGGTDPSMLSSSIDMVYSGNTLTIILRNTSNPLASLETSSLFSTGIGFNLPDGMGITSGTVEVSTGSTGQYAGYYDNAIHILGSEDDISGKWGYDNFPLDSGPFQTFPNGVTTLSVNTVVSTMESSTTNKFSDTPLAKPLELDGPEFGIICNGCDPGRVELCS